MAEPRPGGMGPGGPRPGGPGGMGPGGPRPGGPRRGGPGRGMRRQFDALQELQDANIKLSLSQNIKNILLMLGYYVKYARGFFIAQITNTILSSIIGVLTGTIFLKIVFDALEQGSDFEDLLGYLLFNAGLIIFRSVVSGYISEYMEPRARITLPEKMRTELFQKAVKVDLAYYESPDFYTDFVWAASQAEMRCNQVMNAFTKVISHCTDLLLFGGIMIAIDPVLLLFALLTAAIRFGANKKLVEGSFAMENEAKPFERQRDYSQRIFYLPDYAKEIRLSNVHLILYKRFRSASAQMYEIYKKGGRKLFALAAASDVAQETLLTLVMLLYLAYKIVVTGALSLGDFAALMGATKKFANRLTQLVDITLLFTQSALYVEKFRKFLEYTPSIEGQSGEKVQEAGRNHEDGDSAEGEQIPEPKELRLENVSFTYEGAEHPSLTDINMTIKPNQKIAIVGYNGAGKSTLVKLLMRLYDVSEGRITMEGKDIRTLETESYRKQFGAVFQDYQIFAATLGENVAMDFVQKNERERVVQALQYSGLGEKLKGYEKGIDTPLTKEFEADGRNLSGGESQKTAIARVFLRPYNYVIMDEPSSALDPISEYNLNQKMMEIGKDKTVIFISHRLSTTCMADCIYMLENGRIIEQGNHQELMEQNGKYAEMFLKQAERYQTQ